MNIKESKHLLRQKIKKQIESLPREYCLEADRNITERLMSETLYKQASVVFCYVGREQEIDTIPVILDALRKGKQVGVPRCIGKGIMEVCRIEGLQDLEEGFYGLFEPKDGCPVMLPETLELVVVPCLSAAPDGVRLGYGGGYYDRYLLQVTCPKIMLCREKILQEFLPKEPHDLIMDGLITEVSVNFY